MFPSGFTSGSFQPTDPARAGVVVTPQPFPPSNRIDTIHDELTDWNWSDQTYQDVHGTRCPVVNNTFLPPNTPLSQWPADAQAVMAASGPAWWGGTRE
jgi:hypothetical protein